MIVVRDPILQPVPITDLRPTQMTVGMREVGEKRDHLRKHVAKKIGKFLGAHMIPVVLGPKERHYIIDHHHLALALHEEGLEHVLVARGGLRRAEGARVGPRLRAHDLDVRIGERGAARDRAALLVAGGVRPDLVLEPGAAEDLHATRRQACELVLDRGIRVTLDEHGRHVEVGEQHGHRQSVQAAADDDDRSFSHEPERTAGQKRLKDQSGISCGGAQPAQNVTEATILSYATLA